MHFCVSVWLQLDGSTWTEDGKPTATSFELRNSWWEHIHICTHIHMPMHKHITYILTFNPQGLPLCTAEDKKIKQREGAEQYIAGDRKEAEQQVGQQRVNKNVNCVSTQGQHPCAHLKGG